MKSELVAGSIVSGVIEVAQETAAANLVSGTQGNFSARDPRTGNVAITPHDFPYEQLTASDMVLLDDSGARLAGDREPSFDWRLHCTVYRERPNVGAVIHTEPPYVNALGVLGRKIDAVTTTGLKSAGGAVPIMPFRRGPRDERFALDMLALMGHLNAAVWGNHGLLVVGSTIREAYQRTLGIEFNAKVFHLALTLGEPNLIE